MCLLRIGPQHLPLSPELLVIVLIMYTLCNIVLVLFSSSVLLDAVLTGIIDTLSFLLLVYLILKSVNHLARWTQTVTAFAGTGIIISVIAIPLFWCSQLSIENQLFESILLFLFIMLIIWNVAIMAHILSHAMEVSFGIAIVLSIGMIWITTFITIILIPEQSFS